MRLDKLHSKRERACMLSVCGGEGVWWWINGVFSTCVHLHTARLLGINLSKSFVFLRTSKRWWRLILKIDTTLFAAFVAVSCWVLNGIVEDAMKPMKQS